MKKKIVNSIFAILTVMTIFLTASLSAGASSTTVTLTASEKVVYSTTISAKATKEKVYNAASSKHKVYGYLEYKSGDEYVRDCYVLVAKGDTETKKSASSFGNNFKWRIELNPYGVATKSCTAEGTIYSR